VTHYCCDNTMKVRAPNKCTYWPHLKYKFLQGNTFFRVEPRSVEHVWVEYHVAESYTDRVPFELLDSAALLWRESCGGGGQTVFLNLTTIISMSALSTIHDVTGRRLVSSIYSWDIYDSATQIRQVHCTTGRSVIGKAWKYAWKEKFVFAKHSLKLEQRK
jgi:hypothetical protein